MNWRLVALVALAATPGSVAIAWLALPLLVDPKGIPIRLDTLQFAVAMQNIALVAVAATLGSMLGGRVGLRAPALSAIADRAEVWSALRPQLLPGVVGGLIGAAIIVGFHALAPSALAAVQPERAIPLVARVLYGGITEEVLVRWGLMSLLVWAGWRMLQRGGAPRPAVVWSAIVTSALVFGVLHVPAVAAAMDAVPLSIAAYVTAGNALFGILAGYLFWRYGLRPRSSPTSAPISSPMSFAARTRGVRAPTHRFERITHARPASRRPRFARRLTGSFRTSARLESTT